MHYSFLLVSGFTMQAFSSAVEVLRIAQKLSDDAAISFSVVTETDEPVAASNGFEIVPTSQFAQLDVKSTLVVVGGAGAVNQGNSTILNCLREFARHGGRVWGISSGVILLLQAGLLRHENVAAHWEDAPLIREHFPNVRLMDTLFVLGNQFASCAGGIAASDLMLLEIKRQVGDTISDEIVARLIMDHVRDGRLSQIKPSDLRYTTTNKTIYSALRLMKDNLFEPLPIKTPAPSLCVSQRHLERLFLREFSETPSVTYRQLRLDAARQDVLRGMRPVGDIALDYGFSLSAFSRNYNRVYGMTPQADRKAIE